MNIIQFEQVKEDLIRVKGEFLPTASKSPTRNHQIFDELLMKEKRFASLIYMQRDLEKDL